MKIQRLMHIPALATALLAVSLTAACGLAATPAQTAERTGAMGAQAKGLPPAPAWLEGAVIYAMVPPLAGENPLQDTTRRLDEVKALGADAIWLSPIHPTDDPSGISYAVTDYTGVREDFGTRADFKRLVAEAHRRGLKVLMDFVPNHTSTGHPHYEDALKRGKTSPYYDHYVRDAQGQAQHYFDWENLKNLNFDHPAVQAEMIENFSFWVREMGVDGFRVDAAWGPKERTPAFWPKLSRALHAIKPDVFLLAEASARDPYYVNNGFDAAYDWNQALGHWNWEKVWEAPTKAGDRLREAMAGRETPADRVARFLNNNDTGKRFISRYGVANQRAAAVLLHTLPGIPVVYMGDEIGAEFEPYEDPAPLVWNDPHQLRPLYQKLAALKGDLPALRTGAFAELQVGKAPGVYAFTRDAGAQDVALVATNFGKAGTFSIELPAKLRRAMTLVDSLTGAKYPVAAGQASLSLPLAKASAVVLTPAK